ncbi:RluA family pseudouridine synthase [Indioceanicola profundi]|uniref:RluA family pseudouridine synthase n=1 Tax=Indioceanicola profundi TaxID=2220096 RepID=UPI001CED20A2|nr:RluA family pseudouridine synthase [Indioceanicola profundi]
MPAPDDSRVEPGRQDALSRPEAEDLDDDLLPPGEGGEEAGAALSGGSLSVEIAGGDRLDRALAEAVAGAGEAGAGLSRSRLKSLIEQGCVAVGGQTIVDASYRVKPGQTTTATVQVPEAIAALPQPQDIPLDILYEDDDLLVIDKPAGLVVHPAAGNHDGTLVNALLHHCGDRLSGIGGVRRPGIVHRLDKDTSGLMVVAKTDRAHQGLSAQFADRTLSRTYIAVIWGMPAVREGELEANIGRHPHDRKRMAVLEKGGKPAITLYRVIRTLGLHAALVECKLMTGRTHQIRVHMTEMGNPLIGDPLYGKVRPSRLKNMRAGAREAALSFPRQALHALELEFVHPVTGEHMDFSSEIPDDIQHLIAELETL